MAHQAKEHPFGKEIRAVVVDGDNTLWKGRVAEGIGKRLLLKELCRGHISTFMRGLKGKAEVDDIVRSYRGELGDRLGQERFYRILIENRVGNYYDMYRFAGRHIMSRRIASVTGIVAQAMDSGMPVFLSTAIGTTAAEFAVEMLFGRELGKELADSVHNAESFRNGRLIGFESTISSGKNKLAATVEMLERHGVKIGDCVVIGDSEIDVPMLRSAGLAMASPYSTDCVRDVPRIAPIWSG